MDCDGNAISQELFLPGQKGPRGGKKRILHRHWRYLRQQTFSFPFSAALLCSVSHERVKLLHGFSSSIFSGPEKRYPSVSLSHFHSQCPALFSGVKSIFPSARYRVPCSSLGRTSDGLESRARKRPISRSPNSSCIISAPCLRQHVSKSAGRYIVYLVAIRRSRVTLCLSK